MNESPLKKLQFASVDKENVPVPVAGIPELDDLPEEILPNGEPTVASTIKPEEADEPLLQENPHRFVLFPIQHHEVSYGASRVTRRDEQSAT
jgi:ribonucleoside-diphosphate reductase subunit M2